MGMEVVKSHCSFDRCETKEGKRCHHDILLLHLYKHSDYDLRID